MKAGRTHALVCAEINLSSETLLETNVRLELHPETPRAHVAPLRSTMTHITSPNQVFLDVPGHSTAITNGLDGLE
jgi:hypothetical protein